MDFLGVGLWEILLILGLAFIILGPQDMSTLGRKAGTALRKWMMTDEYREIKRTQAALTNLPRKLMSDSGLDGNVIKPPTGARSGAELKPASPEKVKEDENSAPQAAEAPRSDLLSAWAHPGDAPIEKRKAMLDDVKRASARTSQAKPPQAEAAPEVTSSPNSDSDSPTATK